MNDNKVVYSTPYFSIVAKEFANSKLPYYVIEAMDCVSIIALTDDKYVLLVQQYRHTLDKESLELPSGHIEKMETPEDAARRELLEETGFIAENLELLGCLIPDTGRMGHKLWCYLSPYVTQLKNYDSTEITKVIKCSRHELLQYIQQGELKHALDIAAIFLAIQKGKLL